MTTLAFLSIQEYCVDKSMI